VSGSREEVTQCIYHICCALLDSPPKGDPRLYRPDGGFSDNRGFGGGGGGSGSRGRERDSYRRERSPPGFGGGDYSNSFEAIADFARRQRGGRSRDDSRDREQRYEMSVPNDVVGAVIGKRGSKINEIRQISGATINIMETGQQKKRERSPDTDRERIIEISGSTTAVTLAKSLINVAMDMGQDGMDRGRRDRDDRRGGRFARTRSRSRERGSGSGGGYDDRRGRRDKFAPY